MTSLAYSSVAKTLLSSRGSNLSLSDQSRSFVHCIASSRLPISTTRDCSVTRCPALGSLDPQLFLRLPVGDLCRLSRAPTKNTPPTLLNRDMALANTYPTSLRRFPCGSAFEARTSVRLGAELPRFADNGCMDSSAIGQVTLMRPGSHISHCSNTQHPPLATSSQGEAGDVLKGGCHTKRLVEELPHPSSSLGLPESFCADQ